MNMKNQVESNHEVGLFYVCAPSLSNLLRPSLIDGNAINNLNCIFYVVSLQLCGETASFSHFISVKA